MLNALGIAQSALVSNDIGSLVAFAFSAQHRSRATRWVQIEAPIPGIGRAGFAQFNAFPQNADNNKRFIKEGGKLALPVLAIGGEVAAGNRAEIIMQFAANNVTGAVVPA